ncbi:carbohydrate ABC transporter permease [Deinococcus roseus]|nr:carbohydrate ABC transporter permease [Deinococcus roseus]
MAAYPLARMDFPLKNIIFSMIIATLVLPTETAFIVNTMTLKNLANLPVIGGNNCFLPSALAPYVCQGLGTYWSVVLPTIATGFGIFLIRQSYLSIPQALIEAARIDGATETQILWRIMVPLSAPAMTALGIFTLVNTWNAYVWPKIALLGAQNLEPLSITVLKLKGQFVYDPFNIAAGAVIMMVPILIVFLSAQKLFLKGLDGAVK